MPDNSIIQPELGFVDLHSHVLPGVDDGPETWDDALAMLRSAAGSGTALIVATPHGDKRGTWDNVGSLKSLTEDLNAELEEEHLSLTVVLGMEVPLELNAVERLEMGNTLTLNGSTYILVELPFLQLPLYWEEVLFQMQLGGLRPIIAHPERQAQIQENPDKLATAVDRGVLAQVTAGSLVGHFGPLVRRTAERLLKGGLVHIIASDCHGPGGPRGPDLEAGFQAASKLVGRGVAAQMVSETPWAIVYGKDSEKRLESAPNLPDEYIRPSDGGGRKDSR